MKTNDFYQPLSSSQLLENLDKQFGLTVDLNEYSREQLEDIRNKCRTIQFQQEAKAGINDLLTNETYQKNNALLQLLNTRIKEMLGEDIKKLRDKMDQLSEGKKKDLTGDKKNNFDDVQVARYTAGGMSKKKAIAKATSDNFKEEVKSRVVKGKSYGSQATSSDPDTGVDDTPDTTSKKPEFDSSELSKAMGGRAPEDDTPGRIHKMKEGMKHAKDCGCDECMDGMNEEKKDPKALSKAAKTVKKGALHKQEGIPKDKKIGDTKLKSLASSGTPLEKKRAQFALNIQGKGKGKKKTNESVFRHNVRFVNESLAFLINEDEEGKAKAITAASDIVNDFTSWMQRVGQYQTKAIIELADAIKADFGAAEAETFKSSVAPALASTLETLTAQREAISNAVAVLAGEAAPEEPMGMDRAMPPEEPGIDATAPDELNPQAGDEFAAADAAAGAGTTGREMRESREQRFARKLAESHSIIAKLAR